MAILHGVRRHPNYEFGAAYSAGRELTIFTVSTLTRTTWPTRRQQMPKRMVEYGVPNGSNIGD
jgi:hypothetical protein